MTLLTTLYLTAANGSLLPEKIIVVLACQKVLVFTLSLEEKEKF